jgi:hypothetical protein
VLFGLLPEDIIQANTQGWGYDSEGKGTHCASLKTLVQFPRTHMKVKETNRPTKLFLDLHVYPEVCLYTHIITKFFLPKKKKDTIIQTQGANGTTTTILEHTQNHHW